MDKTMRQAKIDKWENGCGATLGHAHIVFTGIQDKNVKNPIGRDVEWVYVYPYRRRKFDLSGSAFLPIANHGEKELRKAVQEARRLYHCEK